MIDKRWKACGQKNWILYNILKVKVKFEIVKARKAWSNKATFSCRNLRNIVHETTGKHTWNLLESCFDGDLNVLVNNILTKFFRLALVRKQFLYTRVLIVIGLLLSLKHLFTICLLNWIVENPQVVMVFLLVFLNMLLMYCVFLFSTLLIVVSARLLYLNYGK